MKGPTLKIILITAFIIISKSTYAQNNADSVDFKSSNLPIVIINTNGNEIVDEPKIMADMKIIYNGEGQVNSVTDTAYNYNGKIGIEIRGSSSQMFPKKQYSVETRDSTGEDIKVSLLGLPELDDWILFAPYNDKTLMRDALMYNFSNSIGRYASRSKYCELVLNGSYMGVYVLFEKIKRNKNRVDVPKISETDTTGDALTGGYIFKIDKIDPDERGWTTKYPIFNNDWQIVDFIYVYPKSEDIVPAQEEYLQNLVGTFETIMHNENYKNLTNGYHNLIDESSFVDFVLLNEICKNVDAYRLSTYFYKDRNSEGGKLKAGPIWDFNLAFGNCNYSDAWLTEGWQIEFIFNNEQFLNNDAYQTPEFWDILFQDENFKKSAKIRWEELRKDQFSLERINFKIDSLVTLLSEAKERNFTKWPNLNKWEWPNYYVGGTYLNEIKYLKDWIAARVNWMDSEFDKIVVDVEDKEITKMDYALEQNYPNPFNPNTTINYQLSETGNVELKVFDVLGKEVSTLVNEIQNAGHYKLNFDASHLPSGIYFYKIRAGNFISTKKMILVK